MVSVEEGMAERWYEDKVAETHTIGDYNVYVQSEITIVEVKGKREEVPNLLRTIAEYADQKHGEIDHLQLDIGTSEDAIVVVEAHVVMRGK